MCGIVGCGDFGFGSHDLNMIHAMTSALIHRGPDDEGIWKNHKAGIAFGHRRLSIIDLSDAGKQPMKSANGRYVLTYNGEIYNASELKNDLELAGVKFRGYSDTEVLLEGIACWGLEKTLARCIGMFAFGLWDEQMRELTLVRDRLGIKPLYWALQDGLFLFGSELKSIVAASPFKASVNRNAVSSYLRFNCIPGNQTIYNSAHKLQPGHLLRISKTKEPVIRPYWSLKEIIAKRPQVNQSGKNESEIVLELDNLLSLAVKQRMVSDVPIGAFLSGGIDSSTVAALMQKSASKSIRTFTIGFESAGYNEAKHAAGVARHLGTDHEELYVTSEQALDSIPLMPRIFDEPFADSSQIPTYLLSEMTRKHVTVALSGDGGDEIFAGYNRYLQANSIMTKIWSLPKSMRLLASKCLTALPVASWDKIIGSVLRSSFVAQPGEKIHKLADVIALDRESYYPRLTTHWENAEDVAIENPRQDDYQIWRSSPEISEDLVERMQYCDALTYLPDDLLTKVDRTSMFVSLEARVPILDHRVVEYGWSLPSHYKIRDGGGKWIFRKVLEQYVPEELFNRPKMGFGVPLDSWLRGPLRGWAEDLLSEKTTKDIGLIDPRCIRPKWEEHLTGRRNWQYLLWDILMLHAWFREWRPSL